MDKMEGRRQEEMKKERDKLLFHFENGVNTTAYSYFLFNFCKFTYFFKLSKTWRLPSKMEKKLKAKWSQKSCPVPEKSLNGFPPKKQKFWDET